MKENRRNEKYSCNGITLIALIIAIVLILILSIVVIDFAVDGELFDRAQDVVNKSEEHVTEHQEMSNEVRNLYK